MNLCQLTIAVTVSAVLLGGCSVDSQYVETNKKAHAANPVAGSVKNLIMER